jgi:hypothetical protein
MKGASEMKWFWLAIIGGVVLLVIRAQDTKSLESLVKANTK